MHSRNQKKDAIFCEGTCQAWLHRQCAGLTEQAFSFLTNYQCISSDHHLISFNTCYKYTISKPVTKETFNYARGDFASLNEYLLTCDYSVCSII